MNKTGIPYLNFTWNPMHGCTPLFDGCTNCWAHRMAKRQAAMGNRGYDPADPFKVVFDSRRLREPRSRLRPARIGVSFMGDLYHDDVRNCDLDDVEKVMRREKRHTFVVLTKRPERMAWRVSYLLEAGLTQPALKPAPNIWRGTSASTQPDLNRNLPELFKCPAALRWLSLEPLIEEVDLAPWIGGLKENFDVGRFNMEPHCVRCGECLDEDHECPPGFGPRPDWVVVGCESGPGRRPCKLEWIKSIVNQCDDAGVPCYVKQLDYRDRVVYPGDPNWPTWAKQEMPNA